MAWILDFGGATKEAIYAAFRRAIVRHPFKIILLPISEEEDSKYREFHGSLEEALACLSDGRCRSIQIEGRGTSRFFGGLYRPRFEGERLADWHASLEGQDDCIEELFRELQGIKELGYIAISRDESVDFDTEHVTVETFPWSDWRLIAGAVRATDGEWLVRRSDT